MLHVFAICGHFDKHNWNLPDYVMEQVFPEEKPQGKTAEEWLAAQREKRFVLGVCMDGARGAMQFAH